MLCGVLIYRKNQSLMTRLNIYVVPNSNSNKIKSIEDNEIKIEINETPENNKANIELIKFLSKIFKIDKKKIKLISGHKNKHKIIEMDVPNNYLEIFKKLINS